MNTAQLAQQALELEHFNEAIPLFQSLWQETNQPQWQQKLAYCYRQQAKLFAKRGMTAKALELWQHYCSHSQAPYEEYDHYIVWLLQQDQEQPLKDALSSLQCEHIDENYPRLALVLGFILLTEKPELVNYLPAEAEFIQDYRCIERAIVYFQAGQFSAVNEQLRKISYRSAFKDLKIILKATLIFPDIERVKLALSGVTEKSPYSRIAHTVMSCCYQGMPLWSHLKHCHSLERHFIYQTQGYCQQKTGFMESLSGYEGLPDCAEQLDLVINYRVLIGLQTSLQFCLFHLPEMPRFKKVIYQGFEAMTAFDEYRVKALRLEQQAYFEDAVYFWQLCVEQLKQRQPLNHLKIAMLLRHMAEIEPSNLQKNSFYQQSLDHGPENKRVYLALLNDYFNHDVIQFYNYLVEAKHYFPEASEIIKLAFNQALQWRAYRKAAYYAGHWLKQEPLNRHAKDALYSCELACARKSASRGYQHIMQSDLNKLEALISNPVQRYQSVLLHAVYIYQYESKTEALQLINERLQQNEQPICGVFILIMELELSGLSFQKIKEQLALPVLQTQSARVLFALIKLINSYLKIYPDPLVLKVAIAYLKPAVMLSLSEFSNDETLLRALAAVSEQLHDFEWLASVFVHAEAFAEQPYWIYFQIYLALEAEIENVSQEQLERLEQAKMHAVKLKDNEALLRLEALLQQYDAINYIGSDLLPVAENDSKPLQGTAPIQQRLSHLSKQQQNKLEQNTEKIRMTLMPDELIEEVAQQVSMKYPPLYQAVMNDMDFLSALFLVKSANQSGQSIQLSYTDVLNHFGYQEPKGFFSFLSRDK